jgi:DNA mismatch repair protein MutL
VPSRIRVLDDATINKIAAGEVVERPASAVKELLENALDADASSITVAVEEGGKKSISVRDDGIGMSPEDAEKAFERHSTSKISNIDDLQRLVSYGFRGEALSSIAAVSRVTLRTQEHDAAEGIELIVNGGRIEKTIPVGCPAGTEIVVEDLFQNMPARRKSLRSKSVELAHCREVIINYMLCRPGLAFSFRSDGDIEMVHVPAEGMRGSLVAAFGPKIAGNMMSGEAETEAIRVEAYLGRLEHTRSSLADLKLFVNDRPVKSQKLASVVVAAYGSKLMKDRYPVGTVRLFIDSSEVDVNVHPSKREVRFDDEARVADIVRNCVEKALGGSDLSFKYDLTKFSEAFEPVPETAMQGTVVGIQSTIPIEERRPGSEGKPVIVPLAHLMNTYILAESGGNLLLIDQHAASERIVYETVLKAIQTGREISQRLLTPLVIHLSSSEQKVLEENRETLDGAGFDIQPFGKGTYALKSIPTVLGVAQGESAFRNILGDLGRIAPSKKVGLDVIWRVACHTAIRAGDPLSENQMRALVSELLRTENPYTCEHGRPTMIGLSPVDLEKLFKRRV